MQIAFARNTNERPAGAALAVASKTTATKTTKTR
jgi:hypothetical protein